jgi:hypothetical protein
MENYIFFQNITVTDVVLFGDFSVDLKPGLEQYHQFEQRTERLPTEKYRMYCILSLVRVPFSLETNFPFERNIISFQIFFFKFGS